MEKMMKEYIKYVEEKLNNKKTDYKELKDDILVHLGFFKHERLIHFLVTMLVALVTTILLVTTLFVENLFVLLILLIFIILLLFYIKHYYFLENSVQYLYTLYNETYEKSKKK